MVTTYKCFFSREEDNDFLSNIEEILKYNCFLIHFKYIHCLQLTYPEPVQITTLSSVDSFLVPFDDIFINASTVLYTMLSNHNTPATFVDDLSSKLIDFATAMIADNTSTGRPQILPITFTVFAESSNRNYVQEFDRVLEESINDEYNFRHVCADLCTTIDEMLKKVDIGSSSNGVTENSCSICLEKLLSSGLNMDNNDDNNNIVSTPCSHVYHKECIVRWLETNGSCPLCRFAML